MIVPFFKRLRHRAPAMLLAVVLLGGCRVDHEPAMLLAPRGDALYPDLITRFEAAHVLPADGGWRRDTLESTPEATVLLLQVASATPSMLHLQHATTLLVRSGQGSVIIGGLRRKAERGGAFHVPPGTAYQVRGEGAAPLVLVQVISPGMSDADMLVAPPRARSYERTTPRESATGE